MQPEDGDTVEPATGSVHEDVFPENGKAVHDDRPAGGNCQNGDGLIGYNPAIPLHVSRQQNQQSTVKGAHGRHASHQIL
ncbi:uncharacterized protein METZ01_LOCUS230754, partial [marine metagenome]